MCIRDRAKKEPQHLKMFDDKEGRLRWDWRKENPGEVVAVILLLAFILALPKAGCGVTTTEPAKVPKPAPAVEAPADGESGAGAAARRPEG